MLGVGSLLSAAHGRRRIRCRPAIDTVIGELQYVVAQHEDTLLDIGRRHGVGYEEIVAANPGVDAVAAGRRRRRY